MAHEKLKAESYQNLGGINLKASPYLTGPQEFLNLVNFDFQTPGSLTKRPGSTQYFTQGYTGRIHTLYEYARLNGSSYLFFGVSGGLWFGATQGQFQGLSFSYAAAPQILGGTFLHAGLNAYVKTNGFQFFSSAGVLRTNSTDQIIIEDASSSIACQALGSSYSLLFSGITFIDNQYSIVTINDWMFAADGQNFFKTDGTTTSFYGLPPCLPSVVTSSTAGASLLFAGAGASGTLKAGFDYYFGYSFVNRRGYESPITVAGSISAHMGESGVTGVAWAENGFTLPVAIPQGFDISSVKFYVAVSAGTTGTSKIRFQSAANVFSKDFLEVSTTAVSGATVVSIYHGLNWNADNTPYPYPSRLQTGYSFLGVSYVLFDKTTQAVTFNQANFAPKYLEVYNNQLMMAGFTNMQSTVVFSDIGEPEGVMPENTFEVRTNDGDIITGMRAYQSNLMIFKNNSYHQLSGEDPANFNLRQVSDSYGCVNHRCTAVYEDFLLFLDRKGIIRHNGANQETISAKIQDVFDSMNYEAAKTTACMAHDKKRNQILTAIPVNGATLNNLTVVYDYLCNAWTKYEGFNPALFRVMNGIFSSRTLFYGGYTGNIYNFGASFFGDNGSGFTALYKTRYLSELGHSVEKQYRRLYVDCDTTAGASSIFNIVMYPSFQNSVGFTGSMTAAAYQSRIDFGLSTKSLAYELSAYSATFPTKIHGYVLEYRFQRNV